MLDDLAPDRLIKFLHPDEIYARAGYKADLTLTADQLGGVVGYYDFGGLKGVPQTVCGVNRCHANMTKA
jgi:hypothetical protein